MTVKDVCQKYGVSRQTVYNRFKAAGLDITKLKDQQTGAFTQDGEIAIANLFSDSDRKASSKALHSVKDNDLQAVNIDLQNRLDEALAEKRQLAAMLERQQQITEQQQRTIQDMTEQIATAQRLLTAPEKKRWRWPWGK